MRTGFKILLGCLATPVVLLLLFLVLHLAFRAVPLPEAAPGDASSEPSATVTLDQLVAEGLTSGKLTAPEGRAVPVSLILEEGNFTVKPSPPGEGFKVEGNYDKAMYKLEHSIERDASGAVSFRLSFVPRYSMFRRILSVGSFEIDDNTNVLTVYVPRDVPLDLTMQVSKGESHIDLGGLSIASAALELQMGEHSVTVEEPNPIEMSSLKVNQSMGEINLSGLGNLRAGNISIWGGMGELNVDMGEALHRDTKMFARMRMGEISIGLPTDARIEAHNMVFLGGSSGSPDRAEGTHRLDIEASATMGELSYHDSRFIADPL